MKKKYRFKILVFIVGETVTFRHIKDVICKSAWNLRRITRVQN